MKKHFFVVFLRVHKVTRIEFFTSAALMTVTERDLVQDQAS